MIVSTERIKVMLLIKASLFRRGVEQALVGSESIELSPVFDIDDVPYISKGSSRGGVAVVDIDLPENGGFAICRQLKSRLPEAGIIAFTDSYDDGMLLQVLQAQASACLKKDVSAEQLLETVYNVAKGQHPIKDSLMNRPLLAEQVFRQFQILYKEQNSRISSTLLTRREVEVLTWVSRGLMNREIAVRLAISEQTVKNHVCAIFRKLGVNNRQEAVSLSKKQGIIYS
jgi:two-component system, NarL family, response regulator DegU